MRGAVSTIREISASGRSQPAASIPAGFSRGYSVKAPGARAAEAACVTDTRRTVHINGRHRADGSLPVGKSRNESAMRAGVKELINHSEAQATHARFGRPPSYGI